MAGGWPFLYVYVCVHVYNVAPVLAIKHTYAVLPFLQYHGHAQVMLADAPFPTLQQEAESVAGYDFTHGTNSRGYYQVPYRAAGGHLPFGPGVCLQLPPSAGSPVALTGAPVGHMCVMRAGCAGGARGCGPAAA